MYSKKAKERYARWYTKVCKTDEYRDAVRKRQLKIYYNISVEDYDTMLRYQNGLCAICSMPSPDNRRLSIDHDHSTGKVRALLCRKCNSGLGYFGDNLDVISKAAEYLKFHKEGSLALS